MEKKKTTDLAEGITVGGVPLGKIIIGVLKGGPMVVMAAAVVIIGIIGISRMDKVKMDVQSEFQKGIDVVSSRMDRVVNTVEKVDRTMMKVTTTLELVPPSDLKKELENIRLAMVTADDLRTDAPWKAVEPDWKAWRTRIENRLMTIERKLR